jgi:DNA-binding transcriptional regulator YhcF (GntR family)
MIKLSELHIQDNFGSTKVKHLTDILNDAISQGKYKTGQQLPSVNQLSRQYNLSRDTVFKAYRELKKRGIVDSTPAKGYHVASAMNKVLLMLDVYSPFKDVLYNSFVGRLSKNFKVDLVFHFYNEHLFETVIADSIGRYNYYVIMNFSNDALHGSLRKIDPAKLLILDLGDFEKNDYSYVCQDFGISVYKCLESNISLIRKYKRFVLYLPEESEHPKILIRFFKKFAKDHMLTSDVIQTRQKINLIKHTAYFIIQQKDLVEMVKSCRASELRIGQDIGMIAYNDTPMYEIIENGITVISTDFSLMGQKAADFVKTRQKIHEVILTRMIVRGSL